MLKNFLCITLTMSLCLTPLPLVYNKTLASEKALSIEKEAYTSPIAGENSISTLEKISIGGVDQWITIRGQDLNNPIFLYLHGGPGHGEINSNPRFKELEKRYVVVNWEQRGSGKSFSPHLPVESLNVEQYLSDTHEMVEYIKNRFKRDKIYLVGHSWGSLLGMIEISRHPDSFYAYVGVGQFVDVTKADQIGYDYTLYKAKELGHQAAIDELKTIGRPPYDSFNTFLRFRKWLAPMGGIFFSPTYIQEVMIPDIMNATEYTHDEKGQYELSEELLLTKIVPELPKYNLLHMIHEVKVPVYFVAGKHDYNTPLQLVEQFNSQLVAPHKEVVVFENSGHAPNYEEELQFADLMNEHIFHQTYYSPNSSKSVKVVLNDHQMEWTPAIHNGQLMLPLRKTLEALGGTITWEESTNTIMVTYNQLIIFFQQDAAVAKVNGKEIGFSKAVLLLEDSSYLSVEALLKTIQLHASWDPALNELILTSTTN
ncbi:alpha/beta fold hydrolase [Paenibacillus silviterrae]|uniref:alpha/beta fold hydrolase n=1 Tax=Paenibacillus silviterrae TaxID=3242194 RepID=UPI002543B081|nr:alpha/beta fold hydrolase [Paenibacillus chinjuensis]